MSVHADCELTTESVRLAVLERIAKLDKAGPRLNVVLTVNADVLKIGG